MKIPDAKAAVDKEWKELEIIPVWQLEKVKSKMEVILEAQRDNNKVHFAALMDLCHQKNSKSGATIAELPKTRTFLQVFVDDTKMDVKKQNIAPMWKKLMKHVDLDEPTSYLDLVYLGCTQRERKPNEDRKREMVESRITATASEKLTGWEKPHAKTVARVLRHGRTCSKRRWKILLAGE